MSETLVRPATEEGTPRRRRWTWQEIEKASEAGLFGDKERLELIEGDLIEKMTQHSPHATALLLTEEALRAVLPPGHHLRTQLPLSLDDYNQPEPDVALVAGRVRDYSRSHPVTALLVVEVAGSSLPSDRAVKGGLYARAGIPEYWIVNVVDRVLEVHRDPGPLSGAPLGHAYNSVTRHAAAQTVTTLVAPDQPVSVADLLP